MILVGLVLILVDYAYVKDYAVHWDNLKKKHQLFTKEREKKNEFFCANRKEQKRKIS
jgi:hypothetical protein